MLKVKTEKKTLKEAWAGITLVLFALFIGLYLVSSIVKNEVAVPNKSCGYVCTVKKTQDPRRYWMSISLLSLGAAVSAFVGIRELIRLRR